MASRFVLPFADVGSGIKPANGAKLFFFETGTSTPKDTWADGAETTPNANPVISDSTGVFSDIFINGKYKVILKDKNDVQIWEADPVVSEGVISSGLSGVSFENVANMISGTVAGGTVTHEVDAQYSSGGTFWRVDSVPVSSISDFEALSSISVNDFGDVNDISNIIEAYNNRNGFPVIASGTTANQIKVPSDFDTLQDAFNFAVAVLWNEDPAINILIETGHEPTGGIFCDNGIFSYITVIATDATVTLSPTFNIAADFIAGISATTPNLNCLIDAQGRCRHGVSVQTGSHIDIGNGGGVNNATQRGIYVNTVSTANASDSLFKGAGSIISTGLNRGAWVARGSVLICERADFSDSEGIGIYVSRASKVHGMDCIAEQCGEQAVWVHRSSQFTAHSIDGVSFSTKGTSVEAVIRATRTSAVSINSDDAATLGAIHQRGTGAGVEASSASIVNINSTRLTQSNGVSGDGISCGTGATVSAASTFISGYNNGITNNGGEVSAALVVIALSRNHGVNTKRGHTNIASGSVTNSSVLDIVNEEGAFTNADLCTTTNGAGTPSLTDVNVPAFNALTGRGVIFT